MPSIEQSKSEDSKPTFSKEDQKIDIDDTIKSTLSHSSPYQTTDPSNDEEVIIDKKDLQMKEEEKVSASELIIEDNLKPKSE